MAPTWPPEGTPELELLLPGVNTFILISSSFVAHRADVAIKHNNDVAGVRKWFGLTILMGVTFLAGQIYEYNHLEFGLTTNLFASTFYVLTGFHGLHVFVGVLLMTGVLWRSRRPGHYSTESHFGIEAAEGVLALCGCGLDRAVYAAVHPTMILGDNKDHWSCSWPTESGFNEITSRPGTRENSCSLPVSTANPC